MKYILKKWYLVLATILLLNCEKDELSEEDVTEKDNITAFVSESNLHYNMSETGLYYAIIDSGQGENPEADDFVKYQYNLWLIDGTLVQTTDSAMAVQHDLYSSDALYGADKRQVKNLISGVSEGLSYLKSGGKAQIVVPYNLGYGKYERGDGQIPAYSTLIFDLEIEKIIKDPEAEEQATLDSFINLSAAEPLNKTYTTITDGLYYRQITEGNEKKVGDISLIIFSTETYMLDGRMLGETDYSTLSKDIDMNGLKLCISQMTEGEKGELIVRSDLAYGSDPNLSVPPYSTLRIIVEIKELN